MRWMSCSLRLTQEFYGLARDFGIVARELGRDDRRECLRASQRVWRLRPRASRPRSRVFRRASPPPYRLRFSSYLAMVVHARRALATNGNLDAPTSASRRTFQYSDRQLMAGWRPMRLESPANSPSRPGGANHHRPLSGKSVVGNYSEIECRTSLPRSERNRSTSPRFAVSLMTLRSSRGSVVKS